MPQKNKDHLEFAHHVKFQWGDEQKFGILESYSDDAEQAALTGHVVVQDLVTPKRYKVLRSDVQPVAKFDNPRMEDSFYCMDEADVVLKDAFKAAQQTAAALPDDGKLHVGQMFSIGVADGSAWYVVTKVNKRTCDVEWRGFCPDRWTDHHFGYGGQFQVSEILRYVESAAAMRKLFAS